MSSSLSLHFRPTLHGCINLPSSKSISNRILVIDALAGGKLQIDRLALCDDTTAMREALSSSEKEVNIGAAGTAMRFATAVFATTQGERKLTGSQRMLERPIHPLVDALRDLGASITYEEKEGFPPLNIKGTILEGGTVSIDATVSSQYISALLMIAPILRKGLSLQLKGELTSRPYVDLTLSLMQQFGAQVTWTDKQTITIAPSGYHSPTHFTVEADWSAASYWYALMALTPDSKATIELPFLSPQSLQGDACIQTFFTPLGVQTTWTPQGIILTKGKRTFMPCYELNLSEQPDLAQTLIVTLSLLEQPFRISGLHTLRIKETNRITALQQEMAKLGVHLSETTPGILSWQGEKQTSAHAPLINTYNDHRMAMAFAPAAYLFPGLHIADPQVVSKSYPHFWEDLSPFLLS